METIKFGVMTAINGSVEHFHFTVETCHPHASLALKSWATYLTEGEKNWIRPAKDFIFSALEDCTGLFNVLMLIENPEQSPSPRMEFYREVMEPVQFQKKSAQVAKA